MIRLSQVGKRYGDRDALRGVDLELPRGSLNFLMGPSGAGKSTLLRLLLALERPDAGQVEVAGVDLGTLPRRQRPAYLRRVGAVFQDPQLLADRTVYKNVALPLQLAGYPEASQGPRVRAALAQVGLAGAEGRLPRALSTGSGSAWASPALWFIARPWCWLMSRRETSIPSCLPRSWASSSVSSRWG